MSGVHLDSIGKMGMDNFSGATSSSSLLLEENGEKRILIKALEIGHSDGAMHLLGEILCIAAFGNIKLCQFFKLLTEQQMSEPTNNYNHYHYYYHMIRVVAMPLLPNGQFELK